jgi:hypothetical protein
MLPNPFYHDRHFNHPIMNNCVGDPNTAKPLSDGFFLQELPLDTNRVNETIYTSKIRDILASWLSVFLGNTEFCGNALHYKPDYI